MTSTEQASVKQVDTTLAASSEHATVEESPEESTVTSATAVSSSELPLPRTPTLLCTDEEETVTVIGELYNASKFSNEFLWSCAGSDLSPKVLFVEKSQEASSRSCVS